MILARHGFTENGFGLYGPRVGSKMFLVLDGSIPEVALATADWAYVDNVLGLCGDCGALCEGRCGKPAEVDCYAGLLRKPEGLPHRYFCPALLADALVRCGLRGLAERLGILEGF